MIPPRLANIILRHQVLLERLKSGEVRDFMPTLDKVNEAIKSVLRGLDVTTLNELDRGQLQVLLKDLQDAQRNVLNQGMQDAVNRLPEVATYEAAFELKAIGQFLTQAGKDTLKLPTAAEVFDAALNTPIQATGHLLQPLVSAWTEQAISKVNGAVATGYTQGQTVPDILRRITGTTAMRNQDGITAINQRQAATVIRTSVQHVAQTARETVYAQNTDVVKGLMWLSTLDSRTTSQCRSLDHTHWPLNEGPRPPIHPNCRSTTVPDLDEAFDFLDEGATRSSSGGYVSADQSYYDWLGNQSEGFQDNVLGPTRGQLFRDGGLTADQFAALQLNRNFEPMTLAEMKAAEPLAFQKAGLDDV